MMNPTARIFPLGTILEGGTPNYNPNDYYINGVWERYAKGRTTVGLDETQTEFNTIGKEGGVKIHRHIFKIGQTMYYGGVVGDDFTGQGAFKYSTNSYAGNTSNGGNISIRRNNVFGTSQTQYNEYIRESVGDTDNSSSLQPYKTVYKWILVSYSD